MWKKAALA